MNELPPLYLTLPVPPDDSIALHLDRPCENCRGSGWEPGQVATCPECRGKGRRPTEAGRAILGLMSRYAE